MTRGTTGTIGSLGGLQDELDGLDVPAPACRLRCRRHADQRLVSRVVLRAPVVLGRAPSPRSTLSARAAGTRIERSPGSASSTPRESCWMRCPIPQPCMGSRVSVLRMRRSRVPRRTSLDGGCIGANGSRTRSLTLLDSDRRVRRLLSEVKREFSAVRVAGAAWRVDGNRSGNGA